MVKVIPLPRCPHCGASGGKGYHVRWGRTKAGKQVYRCGKRGCRRYFVWPVQSWTDPAFWRPLSAENPNRWEFRREERKRLITSLQTLGHTAKVLLEAFTQRFKSEAFRDIVCPRCGGLSVRDGRIQGKARRRCRDCGYRYVVQARWRRLDK